MTRHRPVRQTARSVPALAAILLAHAAAGCNPVVRAAADWVQTGDRRDGVTYYVGGAGPIGNVGALSIPQGMQDAGYRGYVEVFTWQSVTAAFDQVALDRNLSKGRELARRIERQIRRHPNAPVNIIALSAGTGIATFALERLPERYQVQSVVFLASSLSSDYDLTPALRRVSRGLYAFYSPEDPILRHIVPYTGTVDRRESARGVAGLSGFRIPRGRRRDTVDQYAKLHNVRYRREFARHGYEGGHTDATSRDFIRAVVAPLILPREVLPVSRHRASSH